MERRDGSRPYSRMRLPICVIGYGERWDVPEGYPEPTFRRRTYARLFEDSSLLATPSADDIARARHPKVARAMSNLLDRPTRRANRAQ